MPPSQALAIAEPVIAIVVIAIVVVVAVRNAARLRRELAIARSRALELELGLAEQTDRLRISGELTGLASASLGSLTASAESVRRIAASDPEAAVRAAEALQESAREATANLRRAVDNAREGRLDAEHLEVAPDLDGLARLADGALDDGVRVVIQELGERLPLKAGAELAIYRILQEAIANAARHGGRGTTLTISLRWSDEGVQVLADDDGVRAAARRGGEDPDTAVAQRYTRDDDLAALTATPDGRGIQEMRTRTELFGGVFTATPVPGVGFSISAIFPALLHHNGVHGVKL